MMSLSISGRMRRSYRLSAHPYFHHSFPACGMRAMRGLRQIGFCRAVAVCARVAQRAAARYGAACRTCAERELPTGAGTAGTGHKLRDRVTRLHSTLFRCAIILLRRRLVAGAGRWGRGPKEEESSAATAAARVGGAGSLFRRKPAFGAGWSPVSARNSAHI